MYNKQRLEIGFIILSPEGNIAKIKATKSSIGNHYPGTFILVAVPKNIPEEQLQKIQEICPVVVGQNTITSLINAGFKKAQAEWNILVEEGIWVKPNIDKKYSCFYETEKDIFYSVICEYDQDNKPIKIHDTFWDCTLNGIMIHRLTFKNIGNFSDNPLEISRLMWTLQAQDIGCKFKAVLGAKI